MLDVKEHLKTLVEAHAPSGHEEPIREIIRSVWKPLTNRMEQDKLGSLIGIKQATHPVKPARKIMLAAHMDFSPETVDRVGRFWNAARMAEKPGLRAVDLFAAMAEGSW